MSLKLNRRNTTIFLIAGVMAACVMLLSLVTTAKISPSRAGHVIPKQLKAELDLLFNKYELLRLNPGRVMRQVRDTGRLQIVAAQKTLNLLLEPRDVRAPNYRANEVAAGGSKRQAQGRPLDTFKGKMVGEDNTGARFTINENRVEGLILSPDETYYLEPASRYSSSASSEDYVFYGASDVIRGAADVCGLTLHEAVNSTTLKLAPQAQESVSVSRVLEIATEADYEYVNSFGGAEKANAEILSILNQVEGVYEKELGITFQVVFQNAWGTTGDPYTTTNDATQLLNEFIAYWEKNFLDVKRDAAHIWTGKSTTGVLGLAALKSICNKPSRAYGLTRRIIETPEKFLTTAHEIGHNFGATHVDETHGCTGTIMNILMKRTLTFCQYSRDQITQHVNQFGGCLDATGSFTITGRVTDVSGNPESGVKLTLSGGQVGVAETDEQGNYNFRDVPSGKDYSVTASKQNFSFLPGQSNLTNLSADRIVHFTLTASPRGPILVTENGTATAIALDSVLFTPSPLGVLSDSYFNPDQRTRIILFAYNLSADTPASSITAHAQDAQQRIFPLTVESVRSVPGHEWLKQINVKLPDELQSGGTVSVSISVDGVSGNKVILNIKTT